MDTFHIFLNAEQKGPYALEDLQEMLRAGTITGNTLYWNEGVEGWKPLSSMVELIELSESSLNTPDSARLSVFAQSSRIISYVLFLVTAIWLAIQMRAYDAFETTRSWNNSLEGRGYETHAGIFAGSAGMPLILTFITGLIAIIVFICTRQKI
jgi:hypothetical protein